LGRTIQSQPDRLGALLARVLPLHGAEPRSRRHGDCSGGLSLVELPRPRGVHSRSRAG
jgi:hypothetical protein